MTFETIKESSLELPVKDKIELIGVLKSSYSRFDEHATEVSACPVCYSERIVKNGTRKGVQKYVCKDCKKNFNYKTNTVLSKVQKLNQWNEFVEDFVSLNITPIKALSQKLNLSEQTVFNWRHKLLSAMVLKTNPVFIKEPVEFDETFLRISRKGRRNLGIADKHKYRRWRKSLTGDSYNNVKVFFAAGRNSKQLDICQSHTGRTTVIDMKNYFTSDKFKNPTIYSDAHITYKSFFKDANIPHEIFKGKDHISPLNKEVHNQAVNAFIRNFKYFVNEHLRGVSTKYLPFYIKWYQFINDSKEQVFKKDILKFNLADKVCNTMVEDRSGLELYRQSETGFLRFLNNNGRTNYGNCKHHYYADKIAA